LVVIVAMGASGAHRPDSSAKSTPAAVVPSIPSPSSPSPTGPVCTADPKAHVYSPDRLELLAACVGVAGTIEEESSQPDGDYHVRLRLDPGQTCSGQPCLDGRNVSELGGDLLLEPVCENPVTRKDAVAACQGYHNPLVLPPVGSHVAAVGPFVLLAGALWLLRGLARSVREGDPFGPANVQRLRRLGFLLVVGAPVVELGNWALRLSLANTLPANAFGNVGFRGFNFPFALLLAGLGAFILAEVFAYGVRLREDVEGTV